MFSESSANTLFFGKKIFFLERTRSTNSPVLEMLRTGSLAEGTAVIARVQEDGRGQLEARWHSAPGLNLTFSIALRPSFLELQRQFLLNICVSLGVCDLVKNLIPGQPVTIKWPNDIYIGDLKTAGILIESTISSGTMQHSVAGIGLNVNETEFPAELPNPTSLKIASGHLFNLNDTFLRLLKCLEQRYLQLRGGKRGELTRDYLSCLYRSGEYKPYSSGGKTFNGKITGVTEEGRLVVETETGETVTFSQKEIKFVYA